MYLYQLKHDSEVSWVSLNSAQHGFLFTIYPSLKSSKSHFLSLRVPKIPEKDYVFTLTILLSLRHTSKDLISQVKGQKCNFSQN